MQKSEHRRIAELNVLTAAMRWEERGTTYDETALSKAVRELVRVINMEAREDGAVCDRQDA